MARLGTILAGLAIIFHDVFMTAMDRPYTLGIGVFLVLLPGARTIDKWRRIQKILSEDER